MAFVGHAILLDIKHSAISDFLLSLELGGLLTSLELSMTTQVGIYILGINLFLSSKLTLFMVSWKSSFLHCRHKSIKHSKRTHSCTAMNSYIYFAISHRFGYARQIFQSYLHDNSTFFALTCSFSYLLMITLITWVHVTAGFGLIFVNFAVSVKSISRWFKYQYKITIHQISLDKMHELI